MLNEDTTSTTALNLAKLSIAARHQPKSAKAIKYVNLQVRECRKLSVQTEHEYNEYSTLRRTPASRRAIIQHTTQPLEA